MTRLALAALLVAGCADAPAPVVFAAASTADVATDVLGERAAVSVGATSTLARQIAAGAPADAFVAADPAWIDWLISEGVAVTDRRRVASGEVVVVARTGAPGPLAGVLGGAGRVALADPSHVPAGRYARRALETAGMWEAVEPRAVFAADVRAALAAVETGAADRALVYRSDARASGRVRVVFAFGDAVRPVFEVAALSDEGRALARALAASGAWAEAGFAP